MRNNTTEPKIRKIISLAAGLPCFTFADLSPIEKDKIYLKILLSRYEKTGKIVRLKRGLYAAKSYLDNLRGQEEESAYSEFLANRLHHPSYLSLEYILYQHNILTEVPVNFTSVAAKKTAHFANQFGHFFYHSIKDDLFCGFTAQKINSFTIYRATKAKALFDFLYFRQSVLMEKEAVKELRLNLGSFSKTDREELKRYLVISRSEKIKRVVSYLF